MAQRKYTVSPSGECTTRTFARLPRDARLVLCVLRNLQDRYGVVTGDPWELQGVGGLRDFDEDELSGAIDLIVAAGYVQRYEADRGVWLWFHDHDEMQDPTWCARKRGRPEHPLPPGWGQGADDEAGPTPESVQSESGPTPESVQSESGPTPESVQTNSSRARDAGARPDPDPDPDLEQHPLPASRGRACEASQDPGRPPAASRDQALDDAFGDWEAAVHTLRRAGHPVTTDPATREAWERSVRAFPGLNVQVVTAEWVAYWSGQHARNRSRQLDAVASYHGALDLAAKRAAEGASRATSRPQEAARVAPAARNGLDFEGAAQAGAYGPVDEGPAERWPDVVEREARVGPCAGATRQLHEAMSRAPGARRDDLEGWLLPTYVRLLEPGERLVLVVPHEAVAEHIHGEPRLWDAVTWAASKVGVRVVELEAAA